MSIKLSDYNYFYVKVSTNKSKNKVKKIEKYQDSILIFVDIKEVPEKGKANKELKKFFKKEYNLDIDIISGVSSKLKKLKINK